MDKDQRWASLLEQFDPLPQELADLIQRDDTAQVLSWIHLRLNARQRDLDEFRFRNPRLEFWSYPQSRAFAELLIDCEEDRTLRAALVVMLREGQTRE